MEKQMHAALMAIKDKYNELINLSMDPEVVNDIKRYTKINKEINSFSDVVEVFNNYLKLEESIRESKEILGTEKDEEMIELAKSSIQEAETQMPLLEEKMKLLLLPKDEADDKNVIIEIRGAAGGDEANIFAGDLFDIYKKWAALNDMRITLIDSQKGVAGGFSQLIFKIAGDKVYSKLKFESGVHRVQRIPATETQGRVHTSTVTITVMPEADETVEIEINPTDLKIDTYRASGAGGQHVNTTDSAVRITHMPTGIVVQSQDGRSQMANKETAMSHLRSKLYERQIREQQEKSSVFRKLAGTGARSEKIRTYNYPQDRVTDHRIGFSCSLKTVEDGKFNSIINALLAEEQAEKIKEAGL